MDRQDVSFLYTVDMLQKFNKMKMQTGHTPISCFTGRIHYMKDVCQAKTDKGKFTLVQVQVY
jgi:hypothetical protein